MKTPLPWLLGGIALTLAAVTAAAAGIVYAADPPYREVTVVEELPWLTGDRLTIAGGGDPADLIVLVGGVDHVSVAARTRWNRLEPVVDRTARDGRLWLSAECDQDDPYLLENHCEIAFTVRVPGRLPLSVAWNSGALTVADPVQPVTIVAQGGPVAVTGARSRTVEVTTLQETVSLEFAQIPGEVRVTSTGGPIDVDVPDGAAYRVDAATGHGEVTLSVRRTPAATSSIVARTFHGDVTVH